MLLRGGSRAQVGMCTAWEIISETCQGERERERERERHQIGVAEWLGTVTLVREVCGSIARNGGFFLRLDSHPGS